MYIKIIDGEIAQYPYTHADLQADFPNTSFPVSPNDETLEAFGAARVELTTPPVPGLGQTVSEDTPEKTEQGYIQTWQLVSLSSEDTAMQLSERRAEVNAERDRRVYDTKIVNLTTGKTILVDMQNGGRENVGDLVSLSIVQKTMGLTDVISFRDATNTDFDMSPDEMIEMGVLLAQQVQQLHIKARAIKEMDPIPEDFRDQSYWQ